MKIASQPQSRVAPQVGHQGFSSAKWLTKSHLKKPLHPRSQGRRCIEKATRLSSRTPRSFDELRKETLHPIHEKSAQSTVGTLMSKPQACSNWRALPVSIQCTMYGAVVVKAVCCILSRCLGR